MNLATLAIIGATTPVALAQPTNVALSWEFSADNGSIWSPNSIVVQTSEPTTVLVRALISWQSNSSTADGFGGLSIDPFVQRAGNFGSGDWIVDPLTRNNGGLIARADVGVFAFPNLLKIDRTTDPFPPGVGSNWLSPSQIPNFEGFSTANPIPILSYSYILDGSAGTRTVDAALAQRVDGTAVAFFDLDFGFTPQYVPVTQLPATITVIPAPTPLAALLVVGGALAHRRRR